MSEQIICSDFLFYRKPSSKGGVTVHTASHNSARDMAYIAMSTALISVCAWISVPSAVPFTMQTFAVFLTAGVLGSRRALAAVSLYVLLGAIGLPVFAGMQGGLGVLVGATGGYISGFLPAAFIAGLRHSGKRDSMVDIILMILGLLLCYTFGTLWYALGYLGGMEGIGAALTACVLPYVIPDLLKIILAATVARRLRAEVRI